ncbi:heparinase II/III family protein, partial [Candidatus Woesearchaeota archaeon]|nr:heparinase II/III family protein [Candidatus Woesearchaeota archaeon]
GTHTIRVTATNGQETKETSVTFTYEPVDIEITHPNLLFSKEDLPSIKNNVQTGPYSNKYNALISRVNSMSDWNPSSTIGSVIWSKGFYAMELGLAYQLTNNAAYAAKGKNYLLGFAGFTPAQYASQDVHAVSDTFWQLSLAYDFLYETMTEQERQTVVNFLYDSCVANDLLENYYTEYGSHNGAGMNQGIGICALAIYGEHPADPFFNLTTDYFSRIYNATNNYLGGFFNSAYALDGISYQDYGLRHTLSFIQAYDRRFPEDSFLNRYSTTLCGIPEYYTFSIWDTDSPYNNEYIRRMDISDIQHAYYPIEPEIMSFLANKCNNPAMQWLLLFQNNNSAWSSAYNSIQTAEDLVYFDKGLTPVHPSNYYGLSWRDGHNDLTIWRDGWTLTNDLVVTFKSDDENGGHPHADDNSLLIFYKEELLTDNGYRNGTNEIPAGENYHNTLVVDEKGEMRWSDLGSSAPVGTRQLFGYTGDLLPGDCAWPNCYYQPITFRGYFAQYDITDEYRAVQGRKPYYTLQDYTRYVVLLNTSPPVIIMKDQITSASEHDYDINFVIPYEDITEQDTDTLLVQNNNANLLIKTIYTTSDYYHRLKYRKYGKQYRDGSFKYEYITSNSVRINNTYNLTIIHAIIPYLDSEPVPYLFTYEESPVSITVYIYAQDKNWSVTFDKADVQEVMVLSGSEVSPPDPRFPKMDNFDGSTSELADADQLSSYENFVLEKTQYGKIEWLEPVDLTYLNIDSNVFINHKSIALRSLPALNKSANLYFYNINYRSPLVYRNSQICTDCAILEYSSNTLKTGVPHFTNYSIGTSARLEIEDDTDSETKYINESVTFYADYYNISNGNLISNADCNLTVDSNTYDMALHSEYELDLIFDDDGTYTWRVVCTSADFDSLNATDTVVIHDLEEEDTCGDDICEPEDDFCPADCNTKSHCGDYNTICLAGQACIDSVCQNIGEESSGGGGSSGGGSGLSGFLTKIENDTVGEQEESVEHGVITEELKQQQEQYLEQPDATEYNDEKARKQLVDSIKIITARMQGIIAFIVITWVSLIVLLYLSSQGQLTNVPVLRNIPKIKMLEPQKKHGLVTMLNLVETNKIMSKAHLQKLMNINDEEFNRMLKFLESKKIIGIDNEKIIYKENK